MASFDSQKLIAELFARARKDIQERFGLIIGQIQRANSLDALAEMLAVGDYHSALETLDAAGAYFGAALNSIFVLTAENVSKELTKRLGFSVAFDVTNQMAVQQMTANKLELVTAFTNAQREATREALIQGVRDGLNPKEMARAFRDSIGLTKNQVQAVANFKAMLQQRDSEALTRTLRDARFDSTVARAIAEDTTLTKPEIARMVDRYRERMLKYRSEVIARTEALPAVHAAHDEAIRQGVQNGVLDREKIQRTWKSAKDGRVRDFSLGDKTSHRTMHNQVRGFGEPFVSGAGNQLRYPGDPQAPAMDRINCRCAVATRVSL